MLTSVFVSAALSVVDLTDGLAEPESAGFADSYEPEPRRR